MIQAWQVGEKRKNLISSSDPIERHNQITHEHLTVDYSFILQARALIFQGWCILTGQTKVAKNAPDPSTINDRKMRKMNVHSKK